MRFQLLATALACTAALAPFGAKAIEVTYNGGYVIEALPSHALDTPNPSCLTMNHPGSTGVGLNRWQGAGLCGLGDIHANVQNKTSVWDIHPVQHTDGRKAYTIRSRQNGACLTRIYRNSGRALWPKLHTWSATNPQWCGLESADKLIDNGQAAWIFGDSPVEGQTLASGMGVLSGGFASLSFTDSNTQTLRNHQVLAVADYVFRFTQAKPKPIAPPPPLDYSGAWVIEVLPGGALDQADPECLTTWNRTDLVETFNWGRRGTLCGKGSYEEAAVGTQVTVWDIAPVQHTDGRKAYTIRSRYNGQCVIRGSNNSNLAVNLFMWDASNPQWCGFPSANALIENGQATWVFGDSPVEGQHLASSIGQQNGKAYLSFNVLSSYDPAAAGQAFVVGDNVFRFVRAY